MTLIEVIQDYTKLIFTFCIEISGFERNVISIKVLIILNEFESEKTNSILKTMPILGTAYITLNPTHL
jgi:hypothetical protein